MQFSSSLPIVTLDSPNASCLKTKTTAFEKNELPLAKSIAKKLIDTLTPLASAGGLAAPQIGISRSIFIYSYDRDPAHLTVVLNPKVTPFEEEKEEAWEACLSSVLSESKNAWAAAKISRYKKIKVTYMNLQGKIVHKVLRGFAAKAFQHEYDHLQGLVNINRKDAFVKKFSSKKDLLSFMAQVKLGDKTQYINPTD